MPTLYMTGVGDNGRSRVVECRPLSLDDGVGPVSVINHAVPRLDAPASDAHLLKSSTVPGASRWTIFAWRPGMHTDLHWTASIDFDTVLQGSVELILEEETVLLESGDCAHLPGTVHAWRSGPRGGLVAYSIVAAELPPEVAERPRLTPHDIIHYGPGEFP